MSDPTFIRRNVKGVTVELRVHPRARRSALEPAADALKAAVTAPAEDGKANDAVIALLSREWRLPRSSFAVIKGAGARRKTLSVQGEPVELTARIGEWIEEHG